MSATSRVGHLICPAAASVVEQAGVSVHQHDSVGISGGRDGGIVHRAGRSHDVVGPRLAVQTDSPVSDGVRRMARWVQTDRCQTE